MSCSGISSAGRSSSARRNCASAASGSPSAAERACTLGSAPVGTLIDPLTTFGGYGLAHPFLVVGSAGSIPASGLAKSTLTLPSAASYAGKRLWYRALVRSGASVQVTNWSSLQLP